MTVLCILITVRHDYPNINRWLKNLYWNYPAFKDTTNFEREYIHVGAGQGLMSDIKEHYYYSHSNINPTRVVPLGPKENVEPL